MDTSRSELAGLRALEPQAITDIHTRYFPSVFRFLVYRLSDETIAEDLAAEVFLRLLEAVHAGKGPGSNLRGWLIGTAAHLASDYYREQYARQLVELNEELEADHTLDPHLVAESKERRGLVRSAMQGLTREQQEVLALRFGGEFSLEETASVMGKKANAIKALQYRALDALRRKLGDATS